ncbi:MAG: HEAT repeat domain-containing protein [Candidatus Lokiarchaeota archaeon]|nr:HEAT repeat domain-containing protein [Candidatus Lokiarchaeota archaeon]
MQKIKIQPIEIYQKSQEFGLKTSANMLTEIIETAKDDKIRKDAIKYLTMICINSNALKKDCYETFESLLISDDTIEIKCEAAKALGKIKYEKALKPLKWVLEQDPTDYNIRISALKAIHKTRFEELEIRLFIDELDSTYNSIKDYVSIQLLSLPPKKLIEILLDSLKNKGFSNIHKAEFIKLIGYELSSINVSFEDISYIKVKYPEILSNLIQNKIILLETITQILKEEDSSLMDSIIIILKILGKEIEKDITKLLLIDDFIVKKNAVVLCGKLKFNDAVDFLITNLDNIYNEVSIAAIEALGEIGDLSAVPELLDILDIEDVSFEYTDLDMKLYILDAIKKIYTNNADASFDYLHSTLARDNNTIRECVAFILGELGKDKSIKPLVKLLEVRNIDVKKNTIIALGKIGNIQSLEHLLKILSDENAYWLIKKVIVDAIYNIYQNNWYRVKDDKQEIARLLNKNIAFLTDHLRTQEDENYKVKLSLIKLLENYGGEQALSALIKRVNDFHRVVRIYASNAIKKIEERLELEN